MCIYYNAALAGVVQGVHALVWMHGVYSKTLLQFLMHLRIYCIVLLYPATVLCLYVQYMY